MSIESKNNIDIVLKAFSSSGAFSKNALNRFHTLGYNTERQAQLPSPTFKGFKENFIHAVAKFDEAKAMAHQWSQVHLLFQFNNAATYYGKDITSYTHLLSNAITAITNTFKKE